MKTQGFASCGFPQIVDLNDLFIPNFSEHFNLRCVTQRKEFFICKKLKKQIENIKSLQENLSFTDFFRIAVLLNDRNICDENFEKMVDDYQTLIKQPLEEKIYIFKLYHEMSIKLQVEISKLQNFLENCQTKLPLDQVKLTSKKDLKAFKNHCENYRNDLVLKKAMLTQSIRAVKTLKQGLSGLKGFLFCPFSNELLSEPISVIIQDKQFIVSARFLGLKISKGKIKKNDDILLSSVAKVIEKLADYYYFDFVTSELVTVFSTAENSEFEKLDLNHPLLQETITYDTFQNPMSIQCGHAFNNGTLNHVDKCPTCRTLIDQNKIVKHVILNTFINILTTPECDLQHLENRLAEHAFEQRFCDTEISNCQSILDLLYPLKGTFQQHQEQRQRNIDPFIPNIQLFEKEFLRVEKKATKLRGKHEQNDFEKKLLIEKIEKEFKNYLSLTLEKLETNLSNKIALNAKLKKLSTKMAELPYVARLPSLIDPNLD